MSGSLFILAVQRAAIYALGSRRHRTGVEEEI